METVLWLLGLLALFLFCGLAIFSLVLGLPGTFLIVAAALVYAWATGFAAVQWSTIGWLTLLAVVGEGIEFFAGMIGARTARRPSTSRRPSNSLRRPTPTGAAEPRTGESPNGRPTPTGAAEPRTGESPNGRPTPTGSAEPRTGAEKPSSRVTIAVLAGGFIGGIIGTPFLFGVGSLLGALAGAFAGAALAVASEGGSLRSAFGTGMAALGGRLAGFIVKAAIAVVMLVLLAAAIL